MEPIGKQLNEYQLPNGGNDTHIKQPPIGQVDELADKLVADYDNPSYRRWYCGVINKFGVSKVYEWHRRAQEGDAPGKLFTAYVNQAGGYRRSESNGE
jgi:hypothetical protein